MRARMPVAAAFLVILVFSSLPVISGGAATKEDGKALYAKKCALCHGQDGVAKPVAKGSSNLNDPEWQKKTADEAITTVIVHGKNKMPKSDKLTPEQVQAIVAHVRTLK